MEWILLRQATRQTSASRTHLPLEDRPCDVSASHSFRVRAPHGCGVAHDVVDLPAVGPGQRDVRRRDGAVELGRPAPPTMVTWTAGLASVQATANWGRVMSRSRANAFRRSTTARFRPKVPPVKSGLLARQSSA